MRGVPGRRGTGCTTDRRTTSSCPSVTVVIVVSQFQAGHSFEAGFRGKKIVPNAPFRHPPSPAPQHHDPTQSRATFIAAMDKPLRRPGEAMEEVPKGRVGVRSNGGDGQTMAASGGAGETWTYAEGHRKLRRTTRCGWTFTSLRRFAKEGTVLGKPVRFLDVGAPTATGDRRTPRGSESEVDREGRTVANFDPGWVEGTTTRPHNVSSRQVLQDDMSWTFGEVHGMCDPEPVELRHATTQQDYFGKTHADDLVQTLPGLVSVQIWKDPRRLECSSKWVEEGVMMCSCIPNKLPNRPVVWNVKVNAPDAPGPPDTMSIG